MTAPDYGDSAPLRAIAIELRHISLDLRGHCETLRISQQTFGLAGDNEYTSSLQSAASLLVADLDMIHSALYSAPGVLDRLASELEAARDDQQQLMANPMQLSGLGAPNPVINALTARQAAASQLEQLIAQFPRPEPSRGFGREVWDATGGEIISGIADLWGLTGLAIFDHDQAGQNWSDLASGFGQLVTQLEADPGGTASMIFGDLVDDDLRRRDPAAWTTATTINIASLFIGVGFLKAMKAKAAVGATEIAVAKSPYIDQFTNLSNAYVRLSNPELAIGKWDAANHFTRGFNEEVVMATERQGIEPATIHMVQNYPTIDLWNPDLGKVTSIKTIDPALASYVNNPAAFARQLNGYADKLQGFNTLDFGGETFGPRAFATKELLIGIPDSGLTLQHAAALDEVVTTSQSKNIIITVTELPR